MRQAVLEELGAKAGEEEKTFLKWVFMRALLWL
jgi:hypothetical protein